MSPTAAKPVKKPGRFLQPSFFIFGTKFSDRRKWLWRPRGYHAVGTRKKIPMREKQPDLLIGFAALGLILRRQTRNYHSSPENEPHSYYFMPVKKPGRFLRPSFFIFGTQFSGRRKWLWRPRGYHTAGTRKKIRMREKRPDLLTGFAAVGLIFRRQNINWHSSPENKPKSC